jgi:RIO kinase 1
MHWVFYNFKKKEFLRKDCENINNYFFKNGIKNIMTTKELFDYITDIRINDKNEEDYLNNLMDSIKDRDESYFTSLEKMNDEVFKKGF